MQTAGVRLLVHILYNILEFVAGICTRYPVYIVYSVQVYDISKKHHTSVTSQINTKLVLLINVLFTFKKLEVLLSNRFEPR